MMERDEIVIMSFGELVDALFWWDELPPVCAEAIVERVRSLREPEDTDAVDS